MDLQLKWRWVIWSHQPAILGIWSFGSSVKQTPKRNFKCRRVFLAGRDCLWKMKRRGSGSRWDECWDSTDLTHVQRQESQEDWLKAVLRKSRPGHWRTPEPRMPVKGDLCWAGVAQPWLPTMCSLWQEHPSRVTSTWTLSSSWRQSSYRLSAGEAPQSSLSVRSRVHLLGWHGGSYPSKDIFLITFWSSHL